MELDTLSHIAATLTNVAETDEFAEYWTTIPTSPTPPALLILGPLDDEKDTNKGVMS